LLRKAAEPTAHVAGLGTRVGGLRPSDTSQWVYQQSVRGTQKRPPILGFQRDFIPLAGCRGEALTILPPAKPRCGASARKRLSFTLTHPTHRPDAPRIRVALFLEKTEGRRAFSSTGGGVSVSVCPWKNEVCRFFVGMAVFQAGKNRKKTEVIQTKVLMAFAVCFDRRRP